MNILLKKASKASKRLFDPGSIVSSPLCTAAHCVATRTPDVVSYL